MEGSVGAREGSGWLLGGSWLWVWEGLVLVLSRRGLGRAGSMLFGLRGAVAGDLSGAGAALSGAVVGADCLAALLGLFGADVGTAAMAAKAVADMPVSTVLSILGAAVVGVALGRWSGA